MVFVGGNTVSEKGKDFPLNNVSLFEYLKQSSVPVV